MTTHGTTQLNDALQERVSRLAGVRLIGTQMIEGDPKFVLMEDAQSPYGTGTSFAMHPGETIVEALEKVDARYRKAACSSQECIKDNHGVD